VTGSASALRRTIILLDVCLAWGGGVSEINERALLQSGELIPGRANTH
jgi:hypothetical protein